MIYTALTVKAMQLAYRAHHGAVDKAGVPYVFHPWHLAEQMTDEITTCAALLHDVVEDTPVTMAGLEAAFPPEVTEVVRLLTHEEGTDYFDYVRAIRSHPAAKAVKLADLAHNSDQSRLVSSGIPEDKREALKAKYQKARAILLGEEA